MYFLTSIGLLKMKDKILFVPECYGDTFLTETLLKSLDIFSMTKIGDLVNHKKGINNVGRTLEEIGLNTNKLAIGIIDKDKIVTSSYIKEFIDITPSDTENSDLLLKKHLTYNQYLIVLNPALEKWLLNCAKISDVNPLDYELSITDINAFKNITKDVNLKGNINFVNFVKELKRKESSPMMTLQNWLKLISEGNILG